MKVVINKCYGGFGLSDAAILRWAELKGLTLYKKDSLQYTSPDCDRNSLLSDYSIARDDPILVQVVEELEDKANGYYAGLEIVEIPDDVEWHIEEYDGREWVAENHRTWS